MVAVGLWCVAFGFLITGAAALVSILALPGWLLSEGERFWFFASMASFGIWGTVAAAAGAYCLRVGLSMLSALAGKADKKRCKASA